MTHTLTDELIEAGIDNISGFLIAELAKRRDMDIVKAAELFYASDTYLMLADKSTGYYWDSMPEMLRRLLAEVEK
jgi:hypothetical protein